MKITIDSTEPLEETIRVIGALYNINLVQVAGDASTMTGGTEREQTRPAAKAAIKPSRQAPVKSSKIPAKNRSSRTRRATAANSSEVRAWAAANGHAVSDRGSLPAAAKAAYAEAHQG